MTVEEKLRRLGRIGTPRALKQALILIASKPKGDK